jgi:hypothetical protein
MSNPLEAGGPMPGVAPTPGNILGIEKFSICLMHRIISPLVLSFEKGRENNVKMSKI